MRRVGGRIPYLAQRSRFATNRRRVWIVVTVSRLLKQRADGAWAGRSGFYSGRFATIRSRVRVVDTTRRLLLQPARRASRPFFNFGASRKPLESLDRGKRVRAPVAAECGAWTAAFLIYLPVPLCDKPLENELFILLERVWIVRYGQGSDLIMSAR
jgi:hypothetical protein